MLARWPDFLELTKPRVVALMLITAVIGMCMAVPGFVPWQPLVLGNIGIAFCAGAAAAINHVVDERIDQKMSRTTNRPVARACQPVGSDCLCNTTGDSWYRAACYHGECADRCFDGGELGRLCLHLHHVFETCDATKYRYWRPCWRGTTPAWLDGSDW